MLKNFQRGLAAHRLLDEKLYEYVALEVQSGIRRDGLWAKALVVSDGSEEKAKANYIKLRVQSLKDEAHIEEAIEEKLAKLTANFEVSLEDNNETKRNDAEDEKHKSFPKHYRDEIRKAKELSEYYAEKKVAIEICGHIVRFTTPNGSHDVESIEEFRQMLDYFGMKERP